MTTPTGKSAMLVFGRTEGQTVVIDGRITIHVVEVKAGKVVLGFNAPAEVKIHRGEVLLRDEQERVLDEIANAPVNAGLTAG